MADKFDPYREALIMETETVWGDDAPQLSAAERATVAARLHAAPAAASNLEYVRVHTGFCRRITVTPDDVARLSVSA